MAAAAAAVFLAPKHRLAASHRNIYYMHTHACEMYVFWKVVHASSSTRPVHQMGVWCTRRVPVHTPNRYNTTRDDAFEQLLDASAAPVETDAMIRGHNAEAGIAKRYAAYTGSELKEVGVFPHPEHGEVRHKNTRMSYLL